MTGHQPDWFHPGVWAKNFLVYRIAEISGGAAINYVIDSDIPKSFAWVVPSPSIADLPASPVSIPFMPSESRLVPWDLQPPVPIARISESLRRAVNVCKDWGFEPLARVALNGLSGMDVSQNAGSQFSAIRSQVESEFGVSLKNCFLSDLSCSRGFSKLVSLLFDEIELAISQYNLAIEEFRSEHGIHRLGRPVPLLEQDGCWFETPLWIYSDSLPERSRLWIKRFKNIICWRSSNRQLTGVFACDKTDGMFSSLRKLAVAGVRIRPRALMTSLLLRVFVSDLFVHGLGGCLYDEMTDRWIRGWLGIEPPMSIVCSMTTRLPLPYPRHSSLEIQRLKAYLRRILWHGETIQKDPAHQSELGKLAHEKQMLVRWEPPDHLGKKERCKSLRLLNQEIGACHKLLASNPREIVDHSPKWIREEKLLLSRETPWIIHPTVQTETIMKKMMAEISG